ncbi:MAG: hypothetical protein QXP66_00830 [Candidatus Aenigmatarchaeota archaeon]
MKIFNQQTIMSGTSLTFKEYVDNIFSGLSIEIVPPQSVIGYYSGTGSSQQLQINLGVRPKLVIVFSSIPVGNPPNPYPALYFAFSNRAFKFYNSGSDNIIYFSGNIREVEITPNGFYISGAANYNRFHNFFVAFW